MNRAGVRIAVENLSFTYKAAGERPSSSGHALSGVRFAVREGEFVSILGANGSGKSTLLSCINGLCTPPPGTVTVYDREGRAYDPADEGCLEAIRRITGTVLQNPDNQIVGSVVEEDCAFGPENLGFPPEVVAERVSMALRQTGIEALRGRSTRFLSGGEKQRLAVAGTLAMGGDILLFDECTAMIDPAGREQFYALVTELLRDGRTIIQITHSAEDAARSSRCLVLDKGVITYDGPPRPVAGAPAFTAITQPPIMNPPSPQTEPFPRDTQSPAAISFDHVTHIYLPETIHARTALNDVSLEIGNNESVAIVGATGCGKSTMLKHINALLLPTAGRVAVFGEDTLDRKTSLDALRRRVCLALQSPETALFETHVADDVAYGARNSGLTGKALVDRVRETMNAVGLPFDEFAERETFTLSGGEARLAALAGVFVRDSGIVLLDEPTAGLDDEHSGRILRLLEELKKRGKTVVVSTHSLALAASFDRVVTMVEGHPAGWPGRLAGEPGGSVPESPCSKAASQSTTAAKPPKIPHDRRKTGLEFFRGAMPGIFLGIDSPLERLSAGVKLLAAVFCLLAAVAVPGPLFPVSLLAALLVLGRVWGKIRPAHIVRGLLPMMPVLTIFFALRLLFSWDGDTSPILVKAGPVSVTVQEVVDTVMILLRLFTMMTVITLYSSVTSLRDTLGAVKKLCAAFASPHNRKADGPSARARDIGLTLGIALRFVPLITAEAEQIAASQISRGAKTRGLAVLSAFKAMLIPLFLRSLERAQTLAQAMLLRLYR